MLTRWKLMAGVLGISIGGLAAAASQCSKLDRTKGRSEETPFAKAEAKVPAAGTPSKPELPLPPLPEGPMASVPTVPEPVGPVGPAGPSATVTPDVLRLPDVPEVPKIPAALEKPANAAQPTTSANELKPAGAHLPTPAPALPTPPANAAESVIPPIPSAVEAKATTTAVNAPQPAPSTAMPSPVVEPTPPKPALAPAAPTEDLIPPVPAQRTPAAERPSSSKAGASAEVPHEPVLPVPAIEKQPQPPRPDAGETAPGMPPVATTPLGVPSPPPVALGTKFRIILRVGEGEPTFEVKHGDNLILKVASEKVDIKSPEKGAGPSEITARGNVRFVGFGAEGTCEELKFFAGTGQVEMMGDVKVQVKDKLGRVESELTTGSMKYKLDASATGGQLKP